MYVIEIHFFRWENCEREVFCFVNVKEQKKKLINTTHLYMILFPDLKKYFKIIFIFLILIFPFFIFQNYPLICARRPSSFLRQ